MSISNTLKAATATVKGETLQARKARLDAAFHAGTKADRTALMAFNGLRKAREDKGYGRAAMAKALKITPAEWWVAEFVLVPGSPEHKAVVAKVAALPSIKKSQGSTKAAPKPAPKGKAKAPATPETPKVSLIHPDRPSTPVGPDALI